MMLVTVARDEFGGPGWEIPPGSAASARSPIAMLRSRGAVRWYAGAALSLIWLVTVVPDIVAAASGPLGGALAISLVVLFAVAFLAATPMSWALPRRSRALPALGLFALSFALFPWLGWGIRGVWTYVGVTIGMAVLPLRLTWILLLALGGVAALAGAQLEGWTEDVLWVPAIIVSISAMMAAFARNIAAMNALRATRDQMAEMAVERERSRVARDLHDILGHSLTVITVKTELAGRLIDVDPGRARAEIAEVEALARGALVDVRATVAGYRGVSVAGELAAARVALDAAGIDAALPGSTEALPAATRELAGWVVREGVTNVIRHAHATRCRIELTPRTVSVEDDGVGLSGADSGSGRDAGADAGGAGLIGLRERVESAGGRLTVGRSELGGLRLKVTL
ncbi:sensor histidine kinase [Microbacterium flavum]|uniref:Sensor histidine kinase n=2 Tax=Microbacterium flavum TaxID=415216 RepID=A0ABS5XT62_9MICO|nr:sensor histidine kinase [Microbacterium flavum]